MVVEMEAWAFYHFVDFWAMVGERVPSFFSDEIPTNFFEIAGFVNDLGAAAVANFEAADLKVSVETHFVFNDSVDIVANIYLTFANKKYVWNIFKFVENYSIFLKHYWF